VFIVRSEGFRELFLLRTNAIGLRGERAPYRLHEHQRRANPEEQAFARVRGLVDTQPMAFGIDQSGSEALGSIALDDEPTLAPTPLGVAVNLRDDPDVPLSGTGHL